MKIDWAQTALLFLLVWVAPSCVSDTALGYRGDFRSAFLIVGTDPGFRGNREIKEACNAFAKDAASNGGRALVVAARLAGAGPYQQFLNGLRYSFNGKGIAPHPNLTT